MTHAGVRLVAPITVLLAAALFAGVVAGPAAAAEPVAPTPAAPKPAAPPKYDVLRFREDWSGLRATPWCERCDLTDRLKAIDVMCPPDVWVNVGGQLRARYETWDNQNFGSIPGQDDWWLLRARLHVDLHVGKHFRVFAEGIYADADGRDVGPRPVDENHGDFLNLFAEGRGSVGCAEVGAWIGRHELLFCKQRLVGPADWTNVRRTFDGVGGWVKGSGWRLDAFWVRPVIVEADEGDEADEHTEFAGAHFVRNVSKDRTCEAYAYYLHRDTGTWFKTGREESRLTLGVASAGPIGCSRFDYDTELAYQAGDWGDESISAGMGTLELGWKPGWCWQPRFALGADWASGGHGPNDTLSTFHQLFPTGHLWFGWADLIGRQNLVAARFTATAKPMDKLTLRGDLHQFWRASVDDAVYNAGGGVLRAPGFGSDREVATEVDLQVKFAWNRHVEVEVGWSHVFAGAYIEASGPSEDVDFGWAQVVFTF